MNYGRVSVVVPVYNRAGCVERCLDSVLGQSYRPIDLIVVDNNSSDNSVHTVLDWAARNGLTVGESNATDVADDDFRVILKSEPNPGASAARNCGLREVRTEYVSFFDSDDVMHRDLLGRALAAVYDRAVVAGDGAPADLVYWKGEVFGLDDVRRVKPWHTPGRLVMRHFYNALLSTQLYMVRTELVRGVGGWNERAMVWNDWELGVRLSLAARRVVAVDRVLATIYAGSESITGVRFHDRIGEWENTLDLVEKFVATGSGDADADLAVRLSLRVAYRRALLAAHYRREGFARDGIALLERTLAQVSGARRIALRAIYRLAARGVRGTYYLWEWAVL